MIVLDRTRLIGRLRLPHSECAPDLALPGAVHSSDRTDFPQPQPPENLLPRPVEQRGVPVRQTLVLLQGEFWGFIGSLGGEIWSKVV